MLATLFDFPLEDRRLLTHWSDMATAITHQAGAAEPESSARPSCARCLEYFTRLWNERINAPPRTDLVSMLAHGPATRNMGAREFMGNLVLLIVGGNDTTRNSMTGGLLFLHDNPQEMAKLRANPALIDSLVPEIIRWQTPLAYMRRTALADVELAVSRSRRATSWRCGTCRATATKRQYVSRTASSLIASDRASTCPLVSASTAASATGWPNCN